MRVVMRDGVPVLEETLMEKTEWYIRDHPGCSEFNLARDLGDRSVSYAYALYREGIVRSWRDDIAVRDGKTIRGYRYRHIFKSDDSPVSSEVVVL